MLLNAKGNFDGDTVTVNCRLHKERKQSIFLVQKLNMLSSFSAALMVIFW